MIVAVIVLAHRNPSQLALLLSALDHPEVRLYLHVDAAADWTPFRAELGSARCRNVVLLPRFRSRWGGIEVVDATLAGLERGIADGCEYFLLVSGQDLPLWPAEQIAAYFAEGRDRSYMESFPLPDPRWTYDGRLRTDFYSYTILGRRETCIPAGVPAFLSWRGRVLNTLLRARGVLKPTRRFPACAQPFGGSQWWNLSRAAAVFVLALLEEHPEYRTYHEYSLLPDEIFFHSIIMGTEFASRNEVVNDSLRFMIWPPEASHPRTLGLGDLGAMVASGKPFARKFEAVDAQRILQALAQRRENARLQEGAI